MSDLAGRVRALAERLDAGFDPQRTDVALERLHQGLRRRRRRRLMVGTAALVMMLGAAGFLALGRRALMVAGREREQPRVLFSLGDGSLVERLNGNGQVEALAVTEGLVELELRVGGARFDVAPNPHRRFRVRAGEVTVEVLGTSFTVARQVGQAQVEVQRGRVRVTWQRGQQILEPGERGTFPPVAASHGLDEPALAPRVAPPAPAAEEVAPPPAVAPVVAPPPRPARPSPHREAVVAVETDWRALARQGAFADAYRITGEKVLPASLTTLDDLLLAADVARSSGHARRAVPYLERALALHEEDERAAVAAFTLGRVLQSDLRESQRAAAAFARARRLSPDGPLAEDAMAREVEALAAAGDHLRVRALAEEYLRRWPQGRRQREVRHFAGIP